MKAFYFKMQEYKVHPFSTTQLSWIYKWAGNPEVVAAAVWRTQLFPIYTLVWILFYYNKVHDSVDISSNDSTMPDTDVIAQEDFTYLYKYGEYLQLWH